MFTSFDRPYTVPRTEFNKKREVTELCRRGSNTYILLEFCIGDSEFDFVSTREGTPD